MTAACGSLGCSNPRLSRALLNKDNHGALSRQVSNAASTARATLMIAPSFADLPLAVNNCSKNTAAAAAAVMLGRISGLPLAMDHVSVRATIEELCAGEVS